MNCQSQLIENALPLGAELRIAFCGLGLVVLVFLWDFILMVWPQCVGQVAVRYGQPLREIWWRSQSGNGMGRQGRKVSINDFSIL